MNTLNSLSNKSGAKQELRPNLMARQSWHDGTLKMWLGAYFSKADPGEHTE